MLKQQQYTHTNGSTVQLLMADGTLPMYYQVRSFLDFLCVQASWHFLEHISTAAGMHYVLVDLQGVKYNIPVSIWLPEAYPRQQPIMYVVPTPDMIIKPHHSFVDPSGMVFSPYLRNWIYGRCAQSLNQMILLYVLTCAHQ